MGSSEEEWNVCLGAETNKVCRIHCSNDNSKLIKVTKQSQWDDIVNAAEKIHYDSVINLKRDIGDSMPSDFFYHNNCRKNLLLKAKRSQESSNSKSKKLPNNSDTTRKSKRSSSSKILMPNTCIFCTYLNKKKKDNTKERTVRCVDYGAPEKIKESQKIKQSDHIAHVLANHDLIANGAHYHLSCYRKFTNIKQKPICFDHDNEKDTILNRLYEYISEELIEKKEIMLMSSVLDKYRNFLHEEGKDLKKAETKYLRESLKSHFYNTISFYTLENTRIVLVPKSISLIDMISENFRLKKELETVYGKSCEEKSAKEAAMLIRTEIIENKPHFSWPPQISELDSQNISVPPLTKLFLQRVINGRDYKSDTIDLKIRSFYQDLSFAVTRTPSTKHILLPYAIKTLTGNVELIRISNRLGHGVSVSYLSEFDTAVAMQKLSLDSSKIAIPDELQNGLMTTLVYDNIDRLEETLSGSGTSHRVNGIGVQVGIVGPLNEREKCAVQKSHKRSFSYNEPILSSYISGKRPEPPRNVMQETIEEKGNRLTARKMDLLWVALRIKKDFDQTIPSWTGFNISVKINELVVKDRVGYLPSINSPASSMATIHEMLSQVLRIKDQLSLSAVVLVCDQAIYAKAVEIAWKHTDLFEPIVIRMGAFHTACTFMGKIGKRFKDAGLRDICIESSIVAEGSIERVIEGKQYNRTLRTHKLTYEALMRLIWKDFINWLNENDVNYELDSFNEQIKKLSESFTPEDVDNILHNESFIMISNAFQNFKNNLKFKYGEMSQFWMSYLDMVELLLDLIRASREGDWNLHLRVINDIIPWMFAYDHTNYARYLPWYLMNMLDLEYKNPDVVKYLENGGFSVQMSSKNPFGKIPMDQTIEETANKDTQTPGGTKGFSLNTGAVSRYYMTADYRKECLRLLRKMIKSENIYTVHHDLLNSRMKRDEQDIQKILEMFEISWSSPFDLNQPLMNISTGCLASNEVKSDLLSARDIGSDMYNKFKENRFGQENNQSFFDAIKKLKLKTFSSMNKKKVIVKDKEILLKTDRNLFGKMALVAQSRNLDMKEVLKYELGPYPWSIATCDGSMRKTNKAVLANKLENYGIVVENVAPDSATIIDAMAVIQKSAKFIHGKTFRDVSMTIFRSMLNEGGLSKRIDIVFDSYEKLSIKNIERLRRCSTDCMSVGNILPGHKVGQFDRMLKQSESKTALINFFVKEWQKDEYKNLLTPSNVLYIAAEGQCWKVDATNSTQVEELFSNQEEADTKMILHAKHASNQGYPEIIIVSDDTDVLVLGVSVASQIDSTILQKRGNRIKSKIINISSISNSLSPEVAASLPGLHAFTGCDTVSAFSGKGKLMAFKLLNKSVAYQEAFKSLGTSFLISENLKMTLEKFVCKLYGSERSDISELRYLMFCSKDGDIGSNQLPPSKQSLSKHISRSNYQTCIWRNCLTPNHFLPSPSEHGWKIESDNLILDWGYEKAAPDEVLEFLSCKCKKKCVVNDCCCMSHNLSCTDLCKCKNCENTKTCDVEVDDLDDEFDDI